MTEMVVLSAKVSRKMKANFELLGSVRGFKDKSGFLRSIIEKAVASGIESGELEIKRNQ